MHAWMNPPFLPNVSSTCHLRTKHVVLLFVSGCSIQVLFGSPTTSPCVIQGTSSRHRPSIEGLGTSAGSVRARGILTQKSLCFHWSLWRFKFKRIWPVNRLLAHWESHTALSPSPSESHTPPMIKANYNAECTPVRKRLNPVVVHA